MKQLRAKLYAYELNKKNEIKNQIESEKSDISWGNQIRSYVLDDSRIKDLRTNYETGNTQSVIKLDNEKLSRPIASKQSLFIAKNNSIIKLN